MNASGFLNDLYYIQMFRCDGLTYVKLSDMVNKLPQKFWCLVLHVMQLLAIWFVTFKAS